MMIQKKKWLPVALHITAWVLFFSIPHFMRPEPMHRGDFMRRMPMHSQGFWLYFSMLQNLLLIPLFYLNVFYLLPTFIRTKRYWILLGIEAFALIILFCYNSTLSWLFFSGAPHGPGKLMPMLIYLIVLSVAFGFYYFNESVRIEQLQKERETETLKSELQFLRWQISPHFLFNALNNMVALARKKSDKLEPMLINLSGIMRYMVYETDESRVSLQKEAQYLESFIHLQSLRYDHVLIDAVLDVPEHPDYFIEPMLLIPFVENAFKHGIDLIEAPEIRIHLSIKEDELQFSVANKYLAGRTALSDDAHGIGLANVKKRIELLYENQHSLIIDINDWYTISLKIMLN